MIEAAQDLTREEYELFRQLIYRQSGINLGDKKMQLVRSRLGKRVRDGKFSSFRAYYDFIANDDTGQEMCQLLDAISTNTTHLFREERHFHFLRQTLQDWVQDKAWSAANQTVRIWSAACSSGEEPYSIAMTAHDALKAIPALKIKILATDISTKVLATAQAGVYGADRVATVPQQFQQRYLNRVQVNGKPHMQVVPELRKMISYARFNLMSDSFPFRHGFHVIFCRNVMIYFDRPTQQTLVAKFHRHLHSGGYLLIGHSESLSNVQHEFGYTEPTVYRKS